MTIISTALSPTQKEEKALHPLVTYDPQAMYRSNLRWSRVWQIAALITAIAFIALATFSVIYTTAFFPVHLPTVSILVFAAGMPTSFRAFKYLWDKKDLYAHEAAVDQKLIQYSKNYQDEPSLLSKISELKVTPGATEIGHLRSVYARYEYFLGEMQRYLTHYNEYIEEIGLKEIDSINFSDKKEIAAFKNLQKKQALAQKCFEKAALCNLQAAYFLHLIQNPFEHRPLAAFFEFFPVSYKKRLIAKDFGDQSAEIFLKTAKRSYTRTDLFNKSTHQLRREIFEGKQPWWPFV